MNSRSPISAAIFMSGNAARSRSRSSVRSDVCEFPAVGSSIHSSGMPMPFHVTEIIRMLIVVLPKSQDWQHRPIGGRIEELVGMPRRGQRSGFRLAIADDASDDEIGIVEHRPERMAELGSQRGAH